MTGLLNNTNIITIKKIKIIMMKIIEKAENASLLLLSIG
jgi:hypothetical protein